MFKDKKELLYAITMEISIEYHYISDYIIALFLIYSKSDEETNDTKPIVTSHVNSNQKGKIMMC